jgi:hypothetical protein
MMAPPEGPPKGLSGQSTIFDDQKRVVKGIDGRTYVIRDRADFYKLRPGDLISCPAGPFLCFVTVDEKGSLFEVQRRFLSAKEKGDFDG